MDSNQKQPKQPPPQAHQRLSSSLFSQGVDVDEMENNESEVFVEMSNSYNRESMMPTRASAMPVVVASAPTDDETQTLLQISHESKAMRACIEDLQQQVHKLEAGMNGGDYEEPLREDASVVPFTEQALMGTSSGANQTKSVTFSDADDSSNSHQLGARSTRSKASRASTTGSRQSGTRTSAHSKIMDPNADTLDQHLSEDTYGFLMATPTCSTPFAIGMGVLLFQVAIYSLMASNLLNLDAAGSNLFSIPGNVTEAVWVAQIIAIVIAVVTQDDIRTGLDMLREGYSQEMRDVFPHSTTPKFALSVVARMIGGSLGLIVNFLLIVTSETVIDLLLNFTALAFVGQLDEASFFLSKQGFAGRTCLEYATLISTAHYAVPKTMVMARKTVMMIVILLAMMIGWGFIRFNQTDGIYLCSTVLVQMGDNMRPELGTMGGIYDIKTQDTFGFRSKHVYFYERASGNTRFGYCEANNYWTLQYKSSPDAPFPADACTDWKARSAETTTFEITTAASQESWYVRDDFDREVVLDPFFLHCFECGNTFGVNSNDECGGRGTCSNAICTCDEGWYGLRCEFREPCTQLTLDTRATGTLLISNDVAHHLGDSGFQLLRDRDNNLVEAYNRPIYVAHLLHGHHMIILYTGRRWAVTHTGLLPITFEAFATHEEGFQFLLDFFTDFHGHWSQYAIEFITEPVDFGTPDDASTPIGFLWFEAISPSHINQTEIQAPNPARPSEVRLLCATCDDQYNPCHFDGVCVNATCQCALGAKGSLCETSPVGNGRCDAFYNIPYFEFDGGDCCDSTCISTPEYTCGEESNGYTNQGYPSCNLPPDRWQHLHDNHIEGDPLSLTGYSVSMSAAGSLLAVGEPEQSRVRIFDKDGSLWVTRETIQGIPDSNLGMSVVIAGGPTHWRNNPNFRAPLVLAVGVAPKGNPHQVYIYSCGNDLHCYQRDTLLNVNGKKGPEAFDISGDGRVVAYGLANPGSVSVYEISADYYEGVRVPRQMLNPGGANSTISSAVWAVRLSEHGDVLAAFETMPGSQKNVLQVYDWDGEVYQPRGDPLLETHGEILQRQLALSADGTTVVVGLSQCPNRDIMVFRWNASTSSWDSLGSPPMREEESCIGLFRAWSVAVDHYGYSLVAGAYPDSDFVTAYEWADGVWRIVGNPIDGHHPGSETSVALSSDGADLAIGLPYAGLSEAGLVSTYSLPMTHCPPGESHHLRLSLTTDYSPHNTLWGLEEVASGETVMSGGPFPFQVATLVEEMCIDTAVCHAFNIYNLEGAYGLERPGRFDLFLDGEDKDRESFSGRAKRVSIGSSCLTCPEGTRLLRMMVHTCHSAEWKLVDDLGNTVVTGSADKTGPCSDPNAIENFYWDETCIDEAQCYSFTVTDTTPTTEALSPSEKAILQYSARTMNASSPESLKPSVEYLMLYDNDVHVASESGIVTSATGVAGYCGMK